MSIFSNVLKRIESRLLKRALESLTTADPQQMERTSRSATIKQFRRVASRQPFYKRLIAERGIEPHQVHDWAAFQQLVPMIDKNDVFSATNLADLAIDGSLANFCSVMPSSGTSQGTYSFGMSSRVEQQDGTRLTDALLSYWFDTDRRKAFLINSLSMGVKIPTSLPSADVSVRSDMVMTLLQRLLPHFDQFLLTSDTYFAREIIEEGLATGLDWSACPVNFLIGGDWFPESYRDHLYTLMKIDPASDIDRSSITSAMGLAEIGFGVCQETPATIAIRRLAQRDLEFRRAAFGDADVVPMIGHYYPQSLNIEVIPVSASGDPIGELVFTTLSRSKMMPLIRYKSGDLGRLFSHEAMAKLLISFGYESSIPKHKLPLVAVAGRNQSVTCGKSRIRAELVRDLLYADATATAACTGQFLLSSSGDSLNLQLQLKRGKSPDTTQFDSFARSLDRYASVKVEPIPYFEYRSGMTMDFERKFKHIDVSSVVARGG